MGTLPAGSLFERPQLRSDDFYGGRGEAMRRFRLVRVRRAAIEGRLEA